ncbi:hypothetical protein GCM10009624_16830 [Gordonia sinesedis]
MPVAADCESFSGVARSCIPGCDELHRRRGVLARRGPMVGRYGYRLDDDARSTATPPALQIDAIYAQRRSQ